MDEQPQHTNQPEDTEALLSATKPVAGEDFRPLMDPVRRVARDMDAVEVTQKGRVVDPDTARGPIRLRLRRS